MVVIAQLVVYIVIVIDCVVVYVAIVWVLVCLSGVVVVLVHVFAIIRVVAPVGDEYGDVYVFPMTVLMLLM